MEETLYQISKDLISAILSKLEIQDKITRITREALVAPGKNKGMTAIETRRILDYISRTISGHMLSITKVSTEPELHRLVYGLAQIAAEVSIVAALKDITYATTLSKKQSIDLSLRKKRSVNSTTVVTLAPVPVLEKSSQVYDKILNKLNVNIKAPLNLSSLPLNRKLQAPFSVVPNTLQSSLFVINKMPLMTSVKGFLNQTTLDNENKRLNQKNETDSIILDKLINETNYVTIDSHSSNKQELYTPGLTDDWLDSKDPAAGINSDFSSDRDVEQDAEDENLNGKKAKQKIEKLEIKAKKAIIYAGDVAYLAAASVVAMRRALTASIEVNMSVKYATNGMSNHQDLMMNLAKTAAQQAGKEAKSATSKSLACDRMIKLALKYTAQSQGANLNHVAIRIIMDTLSLATLTKSMAFVSSDIAINSLFEATEIKSSV
ncbi:hypothetical protein ACJJTC_003154 [Scirpophaga incertulas]